MTYTSDYYYHLDDEYNYYRFKYQIVNAHKLEKAIKDLQITIDELEDDEAKEELKRYFYELISQVQSIEYQPEPDNVPNQADEDEDHIPF